ncbi:hypothetical protein M514_26938 [Trichuris suis]|uniref:Uncharacterized protein n=1 Tax=Trichuris suis TaxID=68888 RepID=A0A085MUI1_9BILA|nr:hypothetical protein M514_26938 [Trichuris suis]
MAGGGGSIGECFLIGLLGCRQRGVVYTWGKVALLTGRPWVRGFSESKREGLVISEGYEFATLEKVAEMSDSQIKGEKFPVEGTVLLLRGSQLAAEESEGLPVVVHELFQGGAYSYVGCVDCYRY